MSRLLRTGRRSVLSRLPERPDGSEFLIFQGGDGQSRVQVRLFEETVWLTQGQMATLFSTSKQNIAKHIKAIFDEQELDPVSVVNSWLTTAADGKSYDTLHYNLDVITLVGYRVRSHRGTQFRIWATQRLREYLVKGFVLDDERLKEGRNLGADYFQELQERIRDVRDRAMSFMRLNFDLFKPGALNHRASLEPIARYKGCEFNAR